MKTAQFGIFIKKFPLFLLLMACVSCSTYHTTVNRLMDSFEYVDQGSHVGFMPTGYVMSARGNNLMVIKVLDKDEVETDLKVTTHTEIRITKQDGNRTTFLLSTMFLKDSIITGKKSVMIGVAINPIHLRDVVKIEFQK